MRAKKHAVVPFNPLDEDATVPGVGKGSYATSQETIDVKAWGDSLPEGCDIEKEMADMLRSNDEVKEKRAVFDKMNAEFLTKQKQKEDARIAQEEKAISQAKEQDEQQKSEAAYRLKMGLSELDPNDLATKATEKKRKKREKAPSAAADPNNIQNNVNQSMGAGRKVSRKIDYEAMSRIFSNGGTAFAMPVKSGIDSDEEGGKKRTKKEKKGKKDKKERKDKKDKKKAPVAVMPPPRKIVETVIDISDDDSSSDEDSNAYQFL